MRPFDDSKRMSRLLDKPSGSLERLQTKTNGAYGSTRYTESFSASENPVYTETYGGSSSMWTSTDTTDYSRSQITTTNGRPTAVFFVLGFFVCLTIVFYSSHLIMEKQEENTDKIVANTARCFTSALVYFSFVSMIIFICMPRERTEDSFTIKSRSRVVVLFGLSVLSISGLIIKIIILVDKSESYDYSTVQDIQLYGVIFIFCAMQTLFIWYYREWKCSNWKLKVPLGIVVSTNLSLAIGASFRFADKSDNNDTQHNTTGIQQPENTTLLLCEDISFQKEAAVDRLYSILVFGFCIFSAQMLFKIWDVWTIDNSDRPTTHYSRAHNMLENRGSSVELVSKTLLTSLTKVLVLTIKFICKHVLKWSVVLYLGMLAFHIVSTDKDLMLVDQSCIDCKLSESTTRLEDIYSYVRSVFYYAFGTVTIIGIILCMRKSTTNTAYSSDDILLLVSGIGQVILVMFQLTDVFIGLVAKDDDLSSKLGYLFKAVFHMISIFCQTYILLKYSNCANMLHPSNSRDFYIRMLVAFLMVSNADRWIRIMLFSPSVTEYMDTIGSGDDTIGKTEWCQISMILIPLVTFYRLLSTLMCYDIVKLSQNG